MTRAGLVVPLLGLLVLAPACGEGRVAPPRHVLLISIDTLRPDMLGVHGDPSGTSPALDRWAAGGAVFENAFTPSPWTLPAHASLLTGLYPRRHGLKDHEHALPESIVTLAEHFRAHGFRTAAIVNSHNLGPKFGLHRGFDDFLYVEEDVKQVQPSDVLERALAWLAQPREQPFFLFLHLYDVHSDYASLQRHEQLFVAPGEGRADGTTDQMVAFRRGLVELDARDAARLAALYRAGIHQMDEGLERLLDALATRGLADETLVALTSDHGEEFLEHGGVLHGRTQYDEVLRVPLILRGPGIPVGVRIDAAVSLLDLAPTLVAAAGLPSLAGLDGWDLAALWRGADTGPWSGRFLFGEADHNNARPDVTRSVRRGALKLIYDRSTEESVLYDLAADPGERHDLASERPDLHDLLMARLRLFMSEGDAMDEQSDALSLPALTPEEIARLEALGYL